MKWFVIFAVILMTAGLFYWINSADQKTKGSSTQKATRTEMSADLVRANQLTQEVFNYVELVETKKMTQQEADRLSSPVKIELENLRSQLSREELVRNDSIRKVLGDIMVSNVMQWRKENGVE